MTCHELIALLQTFPPDQQVLTIGYEDGLDAVIGAQAVRYSACPSAHWSCGLYEEDRNGQNGVFLQSSRRWDEDHA